MLGKWWQVEHWCQEHRDYPESHQDKVPGWLLGVMIYSLWHACQVGKGDQVNMHRDWWLDQIHGGDAECYAVCSLHPAISRAPMFCSWCHTTTCCSWSEVCKTSATQVTMFLAQRTPLMTASIYATPRRFDISWSEILGNKWTSESDSAPLAAQQHASEEVLWKYYRSIPNTVIILTKRYFCQYSYQSRILL